MKVTLTDVENLTNEASALATMARNNAALQEAIENTVSLDGEAPNSLNTPLDMNSHQIINLPSPVSGQSPLRLQDYNTLVSGGTILVSNAFGVEYVINGGGAAITAGQQDSIIIPLDCTLTGVFIIGDQTGSVVLDLWKCALIDYNPPTVPSVSNSIVSGTLPTISLGASYVNTTLTGWTTTINANDVISFNINSSSNFQRLTICLAVTKR